MSRAGCRAQGMVGFRSGGVGSWTDPVAQNGIAGSIHPFPFYDFICSLSFS